MLPERTKTMHTCAFCGARFHRAPSKVRADRPACCSRHCAGQLKQRSPWTRFWPKVAVISDADSCWDWTGACNSDGYGSFLWLSNRPNRVILGAHIVSWMLIHGQPVPDGLFILHRCHRPICVRPSHLLLGTHEDNMRQMAIAKRGMAKLTAAQVRPVLLALQTGASHANVARQCGVRASTVSLIAAGKIYRHVTLP